jgi:hypothetical protein
MSDPIRTFRCPDELWKATKEVASLDGVTVTHVITSALAGYISAPASVRARVIEFRIDRAAAASSAEGTRPPKGLQAAILHGAPDVITALEGRVYRDLQGVWRHTDTDNPVPGARDMTLNWLYPDLTVTNNLVLVPDALVRDNEDLHWVRAHSTGPTNIFDRERSRGGPPTPGWSDVWTVPLDVWDTHATKGIGIVIDNWTPGNDIPR